MSIIGEPFKYDLFISYSHGTAAADTTHYDEQMLLREWTRKLANDIARRLRLGMIEDGKFEHYLDERNTVSGADLDPEIEDAARKSAVILVIMSPPYRDSEWCRNEVRWFFDQARTDGRGLEQCVVREVVKTSHKVAEGKAWPPELVGRNGMPVHSGVPFYAAKTNTPIELGLAGSEKPFDKLAELIESLVAEIKQKLELFRDQRRVGAMPSAHAPPEPPVVGVSIEPGVSESAQTTVGTAPSPFEEDDLDLPQIYLQRHADADAWQWARKQLSTVALVVPQDMDPETQELSLLSTYGSRRREALLNCQGLVLLRSKADEPTDLQVSSGYADRKTLRSLAKKTLPWVLIDRTGDDEPTLPTRYNLPRVSANESDWLQKLIGALEGR